MENKQKIDQKCQDEGWKTKRVDSCSKSRQLETPISYSEEKITGGDWLRLNYCRLSEHGK